MEINGQEREYTCVFDGFIAVKLDSGDNEIRITYLPPGMRAGVLISLLGIVFVVGILLLQRRRASLFTVIQKPATIALAILGGAVFVLLYVMPVVVFLVGCFI